MKLTALVCLAVYFGFACMVVLFHNHLSPGLLTTITARTVPADASEPMNGHECLICQVARTNEKIVPVTSVLLTAFLACGCFCLVDKSQAPIGRNVLSSKSRAPPVSPSI